MNRSRKAQHHAESIIHHPLTANYYPTRLLEYYIFDFQRTVAGFLIVQQQAIGNERRRAENRYIKMDFVMKL